MHFRNVIFIYEIINQPQPSLSFHNDVVYYLTMSAKKKDGDKYIAIAIVMGISFGAAFGAAFNNTGAGISIGISIGIIVGVVISRIHHNL